MQKRSWAMGPLGSRELFIELDDGNILSGKPDLFDGKNYGFRLRFSLKPIH